MTKKEVFKLIDFSEGDDIYIIRRRHNDDRSCNFQRVNCGFGSFELLGLLEHIKLEISQQINGVIKPRIIETERIVVKNENNR